METPPLPTGIRELPVVAGDLALDFANTVDDPLGPERYDHVGDYRSLLAWTLRVGLLTEADADRLLRRAAPRRATAVVRQARRLREAINLTAGALADASANNGSASTGSASTGSRATGSGAVGAGDLAGWLELRPFVSGALEHAELVGLRPVWRYETVESPLWPVALAAYELLTGPRAGRIKRCAGCPWLFLDQSKNGSRRWCSMEICGTNQKVRLYVSRRAARRSHS